jgi:hypothetical protein
MTPDDLKGDLLPGGAAIAAFLSGILNRPVTEKHVYYWAATKRIRVGKDGAGLIASRQALTEDYARKAGRALPTK